MKTKRFLYIVNEFHASCFSFDKTSHRDLLYLVGAERDTHCTELHLCLHSSFVSLPTFINRKRAENLLLPTAIPRRIHRISSDLRS